MNPIYIKHSDEEDSLTHYGVKGMKWRRRKTTRQALDTIAARGRADKAVYDSGGYVNKQGNYQWDYVASSNPTKRKIQRANGAARVKYIAQNSLKGVRSKESKRLSNRGKRIMLKLKTKRAAKKIAKKVRKA